jgi:transglutaminase-like putative cysteine protease
MRQPSTEQKNKHPRKQSERRSAQPDRRPYGSVDRRMRRFDEDLIGTPAGKRPVALSRFGLEIGVLIANLAAFAGLGRLFTSTQPFAAIALAVLVTHGVSIACRWAKVPWVLSVVVSFLAVTLSSLAASFPESVRYRVLPTRATFGEIERSAVQAWNVFVAVKAPTEPLLGFTLAAILGAWLVGTVSDAIAFRLGFLVEALVPPGVVVILVAALSPARYRVESLMVFAAAVALVVASARVRELSREAWLGVRPRRAGAIGALLFIAIGLGVTGWMAKYPPNWAVNGLIDLQDDFDAPKRTNRLAGNPLVSTKAHLVELTNQELFTVASPVRRYWRMTSLDTLKNEDWTASRGTYTTEQPKMPTAGSNESPVVRMTMQAYADDWLPAPYRPMAVVPVPRFDGSVPTQPSIDRFSDSVLIDKPVTGDSYDVALGAADPGAGARLSAEERVRLLETGQVADSVIQLTKTVTAGAVSDFDKAKAIEIYLRTFTYDLDVARRSSLGLEKFLLVEKRGYCEQFASSLAVMARVLGIPSRVAIGFVPGEESEGVYQVRGRDAHAWPELLIDGRWQAFEPTPGRGNGADPSTSTTVPPTTVAPPTTARSVAPSTVSPTQQPATAVAEDGGGLPAKTVALALLLLGLIGGLLSLPTFIRRRRANQGLVEDVAHLDAGLRQQWVSLEDDLAWFGASRKPGETLSNWTGRLSTHQPAVPGLALLTGSAQELELLRYSSQGSGTGSHLTPVVQAIGSQVRAATPLKAKLRRVMSLWPQPRRRLP